MKTSLLLLFCSTFCMGCSSSFNVVSMPDRESLSFTEFNAVAKNEVATMVFPGDSTMMVRGVQSGTSWTSWLDPGTGNRYTCPTSKIRRVVLKSRSIGAVQGALIGMAAGSGVGLLVGVSLPEESGEFALPKPFVCVLCTAIGAGAGILAGTVTGVIVGQSREYSLENDSGYPDIQLDR